MREITKRTIIRFSKVVHFCVTVLLFVGCISLFYPEQHQVLQTVLYFAIALFSVRTYNALQIGLSRVRMLVYSQTLADVVAAGLLYLLMVFERGALFVPAPLAGLLAVQFVWNILWSVVANAIYFRLYQARRTAIVYWDAADLKRLDAMVGYCKTTTCLRGYILEYFGQKHPEICGNCGRCRGIYETVDITQEAQMILSCIRRIYDKLGYYVVDFELAGPYCMLAEARALANGDPRYIGYLYGNSLQRGFPQYVRAFYAAFLALPALPSRKLERAASHPDVVVRAIPTPEDGVWFAIINTGMNPAQQVRMSAKFAQLSGLRNYLTGKPVSAAEPLTLYPGQVLVWHAPPRATLR